MDNQRIKLITALVGSHNYNLFDENSDNDYKIFVAPTFDDLYDNVIFSESIIGEYEDADIHDIRKIPDLFWKSNINFVEILFSNNIMCFDDDLDRIFELKNEIARMNLPYFYKACKGMYFNKMKYLDKGTEGTMHLVQKYGYDTKQALHAYRVLDFITRFSFTDFKDFKWAIWYGDENNKKDFMMSIKHGEYTRDEFEEIINKKYIHFQKFEEIYLNQKVDFELQKYLINIIRKVVKKYI